MERGAGKRLSLALYRTVHEITGETFADLKKWPVDDFDAVYLMGSLQEQRHQELLVAVAYGSAAFYDKEVTVQTILDTAKKVRQAMAR